MHQTKQQLLMKTIERNGIAGITNLALRYYEQKKQPNIAHYTPTALQIEVTTACNLKCTMCEHTFMQQIGRNMKIGEFKKIIDVNPNVQVINITGIGEALMNKQFLDMVEYAKSKGVYVWFNDNFTFMNDATIDRILNSGVDYIVMSLDGATKETFEKIRVGANFETVTANFRKLMAERDKRGLKKPLMGINMVIVRDNYKEIEKIVRFAHELKANDLMFVSLIMSDTTGNLSLWQLDPKETVPFVEAGKKAAEELGVRVIAWPTVHLKKAEKTGCDYPWLNPYIAYNGDVLPCCYIPQMSNARMNPENIMGNIFKEPLHKIWNNEKYQEFRRKIKTKQPPSACLTCAKFYGQ